MSRVNDKRDAERAAEQKRLDQEARAKDKQSGDKFSKLVRQNKEGQKQTTRQPAQGPKQQQQTAKTSQGPRGNALLARQGIASNSFAAQLYKQGSENLDYSKSLTTNRETDQHETKSTTEERDVRSEAQRLDAQQDKVEAVSRDGGRGGQQQQGEGGEGGQGQNQDEPHQSSQGDGAASVDGAKAKTAAPAVAGAPQIPEQALQEIIKRVLVGVNTEGLSQFFIEFKQDVLGGVRLEVSAENGKITAKFISEDSNVRRLLKASEGQLSRAFGYKGLSLERLEVAEP